MAGVGPISQDWEPVVIRKKAPNAAAKKDEKAVNAARRAGADIETIKKCSYFFFSAVQFIFINRLQKIRIERTLENYIGILKLFGGEIRATI